MMSLTAPSTDPDFSDLSKDQVSSLLRLALEGRSRPVDDLIERLGNPDGPKWLVAIIDASPLWSYGVLVQQLVEGQGTREQLVAIKEESKRMVRRAEDRDSRLRAMWVYFATIAAALARYGSLISSRNRSELDAILLDLAEAAPPPWSQLLSSAILVPHGPAPPNMA